MQQQNLPLWFATVQEKIIISQKRLASLILHSAFPMEQMVHTTAVYLKSNGQLRSQLIILTTQIILDLFALLLWHKKTALAIM